MVTIATLSMVPEHLQQLQKSNLALCPSSTSHYSWIKLFALILSLFFYSYLVLKINLDG